MLNIHFLVMNTFISAYQGFFSTESSSSKKGTNRYDQRNCLLENIRQEIRAKIGVRVTIRVYRQLWIPVLLFPNRWQIGVNFAFVLTPKSAVKSSRQSRRIFSTITNSLVITVIRQTNTEKIWKFGFNVQCINCGFACIASTGEATTHAFKQDKKQ